MKRVFRISFFVISLSVIAILVVSAGNKKHDSVNLTKEELGRKLFFDKGLSLDSSISCASCHIPEFAFSDTLALSRGVNGVLGLRNAPSVMNMKFRDAFFYDGRASTLEDQVHFPIQDSREMNLAYDKAVNRIANNAEYVSYFQKIYKSIPDAINIADAIAAFEKTLESSNTPFDAYMSGDENAVNESAKRGRDIFLGDKAKCFDCHFGPDFTGDEYKNIGLFDGNEWSDRGRFDITKDSADLGKFKVPGLRNIGVTGPYMHNGKFKTLREVIEYYDDPYKFISAPLNIDSTLRKPLGLSETEKADLLEFLLTLTDKQFKNR